jgi:beta-lactam-binding protein with PASTA domain
MAKREVPNLRSLGVTTRRQAEQILEDQGFVLGTVSVTTDNDRDPGVSAQVPRGGSQADEGSTVNFRLNEPTVTPDDGMVPMPDLSNMDPDDAEIELRSFGINFDRNRSFRHVASGLPRDTFVGQRPLKGAPVNRDNPNPAIEIMFADPDLLQRREVKRAHRTPPEAPRPGIVRRIWKANW